MRVWTLLDRLSGVDVKAAIRRTRLPFVASLFLAVLLGAPAVASAAIEPVRAPAAAAHSSISTATEPVSAEPVIVEQESAPVLAAPAVARPATPALRDQAVRAALAPRAPPQR